MIWLIAAALAACVARAAYMSAGWQLIHDAVTMQYIASMMMQGVLPYRDIFDMNFPLTYGIHALGMTLLGKSDIASRFYDYLWCYFGAFALAACLWRRSVPVALCAACSYALLHVAAGYMNLLQRDMFMVPLLLAGWYFVIPSAAGGSHAACKGRSLHFGRDDNNKTLLAGLFIGAACSIKPVAAVAALLALPRKRDEIIAYVTGLAIVPVLSMAWMISQGVFDAFWQIQTQFTLGVFASNAFENTFRFDSRIPYLSALSVALHVLAWRRQLLCRESLLLVAGLAYGTVHYYAQQKGYAQHLYPYWAFFCLIVAAAMARLLAYKPWPVAIAALLAMLAACAFFPRTILWKDERFFTSMSLVTSSRQLEERMLEAGLIEENGTLQVMEDVFGTAWRIAYRYNLKPASRFLYPFILVAAQDRPVMQAYREEFIRALLKKKPAMILLSTNSWPQYNKIILPTFTEEPRLRHMLSYEYQHVLSDRRTHIWRKNS